MVAKSQFANSALTAAFAARAVDRAYLALAWGIPNPPAGDIEGAIGRDRRDRKRMAVVARNGKSARTYYRTLRTWGDALALLECRLATGRTHQIRVHLAAIGHPVAGDATYGGPGLPGLMRHFLHAYRLRLRVPSTGEFVELEAPLPPELDDVLKRLRGNSATPVDPFPPHGEAP